MKFNYKSSGVDIEKADKMVDTYSDLAKSTTTEGVVGGLGGFGGMFQLDTSKYKQPILVSGTDGVGTKLELAIKYNAHSVVGQDVVAMCVNDIITCGAKPLFFLDYLAVGKLEPGTVKQLLEGITSACKKSEMALVGGETAEMPGFYAPSKYDVAGFSVGVVEKDNIIDGSKCKAGDVVIGIASNGIHSNGFSLVRKLIEHYPELEEDIDDILTPTEIYVPVAQKLIDELEVKAMAHITGGGIFNNIPRVLPEGLSCEIYTEKIDTPKIFKKMQSLGKIDDQEMYTTFNMGVGYVVVVPQDEADKALELIDAAGHSASCVGKLIDGSKKVILK
ncbi:phosphoribosylformylglycinamidine cyclo-ligase [Proteinivorax hydrogeniformans]|uniref:Phosphoribosylformylglycinamidine cyclo-ligase n=1 Tax=Proteinivorax hydrogeniformans TaxID=1826727 RepID=A0AAU8HS39_9FIRM